MSVRRVWASAVQGMEALRFPEHFHLVLNRLSLLGLSVAWLFLIVAALLRNPQAVRLALVMLAVLTFSVWLAGLVRRDRGRCHL